MKTTCPIIGLKLSWAILDKIINNMLLEKLIREWDEVLVAITKRDVSSKKKRNLALQAKQLASQEKVEVECLEHWDSSS